MGRLFEDFVRGFLRTEHPRLGVRRHKSIKWDAAPEGDAVLRLPLMENRHLRTGRRRGAERHR